MNDTGFSLDALLPPDIANKAESVGIKKAQMDAWTIFVLAVLAGAFIAIGSMFAATVWAGGSELPYGVNRLLGGVAFCVGLILVVVAGAELFTGSVLIVMACANKKVSVGLLLRNWGIVYAGNFVGALGTAGIMLLTKQYLFGKGIVGLTALSIATAKVSLDPVQAVFLGIMCNALVCMAVWLCYSGHTVTDKILAILFPVTAFVAAGFEHCVANMYFIPLGLLIKRFASAEFWALEALAAHQPVVNIGTYANLTWGNFFMNNLIPVTIGNVIGGAGLVGLVYWFAYLRGKP
ncbi:MAG: formate/nitrite transporter family protein [Candidatus Methylumidiphilus sp.]